MRLHLFKSRCLRAGLGKSMSGTINERGERNSCCTLASCILSSSIRRGFEAIVNAMVLLPLACWRWCHGGMAECSPSPDAEFRCSLHYLRVPHLPLEPTAFSYHFLSDRSPSTNGIQLSSERNSDAYPFQRRTSSLPTILDRSISIERPTLRCM
jgi:hypothetical protein